MPIDEGLALLARYPFLSSAREHVRTKGYSVGDLVRDAAYDRARRRAFARVHAALERDAGSAEPPATEVAAEIELLSYPLSRLILAHFGDTYLNNRFAVAESKAASRLLHSEKNADVIWAVGDDLGVGFEPATDEASFARIHFLDFLRYAPARDPEWKLVNQPLARGFVSLSRDRAIRLIETSLRDRLVDELDELERPGRDVVKPIERELTELQTVLLAHRARFQSEAVGEVRPEAFPPCMKAIWAGIQGHVNIPHMGRFAIVSFLHKLGMDSEAILRFFSAVPDFDVNKSRYQIEHITGKIGGTTEYTPPNCSTMQTYGICPLEQRDEICLKLIHHPLSYYRRKLRMIPPSKPAAAPTPAPAAEVPRAG